MNGAQKKGTNFDLDVGKMRILSITAQKPNSTGSGVYLSELVKEYAIMGHEQAVVAGIYREDQVELPEGVHFYPVYFCEEGLPYPIVGMSDEMPYKSTRYSDMTLEMLVQFKTAFLKVLEQAVRELKPDLILCHHLYLLTALVREHFPMQRVYGFCHNTDLRQMQKTDLEREYIREQIRGLDHIYVPQRAQESGVKEIFQIEPDKITRLGMGYNSKIFCKQADEKTADEKKADEKKADEKKADEKKADEKKADARTADEKKVDARKADARKADARKAGGTESHDPVIRLVFAGKIAEKKGVISLLKALMLLKGETEDVYSQKNVKLYLAGSTGNAAEYEAIKKLAVECPCEVVFLGRLTQRELATIYNESDIFVLPSFFEGIPLVVLEALACGNRVVMTELPGVREWLSGSVPGADIRYVALPEMHNTDEPVPEQLPDFERRLAKALRDSIMQKETKVADVSRISWEGISRAVLGGGLTPKI